MDFVSQVQKACETLYDLGLYQDAAFFCDILLQHSNNEHTLQLYIKCTALPPSLSLLMPILEKAENALGKYKYALLSYQEKNYAKAEKILCNNTQSILKQEFQTSTPLEGAAWNLLAQIHERKNDKQKALKAYSKAIQYLPSALSAFERLIELSLHLQVLQHGYTRLDDIDPKSLSQKFLSSINPFPTTQSSNLSLSSLLLHLYTLLLSLQLHNYDYALLYYHNHLPHLSQQSFPLQLLLSKILLGLREFKQCTLLLEPILRDRLPSVEGLDILSISLWHLRRPEALKSLLSSLIAHPNPPVNTYEFHVAMGNLLSLRRDHKAAAHFFSQAYQIDSCRSPNALTLQVSELSLLGDIEKAQKLCDDAIKANVRDFGAYWNKATLSTQLGDFAAAQRFYLSALRANPRNGLLRLYYAQACEIVGDLEHAEMAASQARSLFRSHESMMRFVSEMEDGEEGEEEGEGKGMWQEERRGQGRGEERRGGGRGEERREGGRVLEGLVMPQGNEKKAQLAGCIMASVLFTAERYLECIEACKEVLEECPKDVLTLKIVGESYIRIGEINQGIEKIQEAIIANEAMEGSSRLSNELQGMLEMVLKKRDKFCSVIGRDSGGLRRHRKRGDDEKGEERRGWERMGGLWSGVDDDIMTSSLFSSIWGGGSFGKAAEVDGTRQQWDKLIMLGKDGEGELNEGGELSLDLGRDDGVDNSRILTPKARALLRNVSPKSERKEKPDVESLPKLSPYRGPNSMMIGRGERDGRGERRERSVSPLLSTHRSISPPNAYLLETADSLHRSRCIGTNTDCSSDISLPGSTGTAMRPVAGIFSFSRDEPAIERSEKAQERRARRDETNNRHPKIRADMPKATTKTVSGRDYQRKEEMQDDFFLERNAQGRKEKRRSENLEETPAETLSTPLHLHRKNALLEQTDRSDTSMTKRHRKDNHPTYSPFSNYSPAPSTAMRNLESEFQQHSFLVTPLPNSPPEKRVAKNNLTPTLFPLDSSPPLPPLLPPSHEELSTPFVPSSLPPSLLTHSLPPSLFPLPEGIKEPRNFMKKKRMPIEESRPPLLDEFTFANSDLPFSTPLPQEVPTSSFNPNPHDLSSLITPPPLPSLLHKVKSNDLARDTIGSPTRRFLTTGELSFTQSAANSGYMLRTPNWVESSAAAPGLGVSSRVMELLSTPPLLPQSLTEVLEDFDLNASQRDENQYHDMQ